ncbi:uncharacterized protein BKA55DRAFT_577231 [Fusarium redolens]|uniref:Uncharacterized protein n=1 Tax=Fusarium redolens TaxID=48865 RepID=A0A9P9GIP3_FUSRE|nr:uncharacterized protein BKA55DRAFT_577231 [Fusarium redolens]KAH7240258.1 hypothetical protein BKA55DRAFT_577231 [Fusarium redolens]
MLGIENPAVSGPLTSRQWVLRLQRYSIANSWLSGPITLLFSRLASTVCFSSSVA